MGRLTRRRGSHNVGAVGVNFHISRATDWLNSEEAPISRAEWLAYVRADPKSWRIRTRYAVEMPPGSGKLVSFKASAATPFTHWLGHPKYPNGISFDWREGQMTVNGRAVRKADARDPCFAKMLEIAAAFSARVFGDEGGAFAMPAKKVAKSGRHDPCVALRVRPVPVAKWLAYVDANPRAWEKRATAALPDLARPGRIKTYKATKRRPLSFFVGDPKRPEGVHLWWWDDHGGTLEVRGEHIRSTSARDPLFAALQQAASALRARLTGSDGRKYPVPPPSAKPR
jgi:hypothetical protein